MKTIYSWRRRKFPAPKRQKLKKLLRRTLEISGLAEVSERGLVQLSFVGEREIKRLNSEFFGRGNITDVISFDYSADLNKMPGGAAEDDTVAEIIICVDKAQTEADERENSSYAYELVLYIVHGMLHATGMDDSTIEERKQMRRREKKIISQLKKEFSFDELFPEKKNK